jgi:predicted polyphosphate/ATP-dependent NAD kinase
MTKKLGLIVNPIAGMGGKVGLKGSDGRNILGRARELGAAPEAPRRAHEAVGQILRLKDSLMLVTCHGSMGEEETAEYGFESLLIGSRHRGQTDARDTQDAARQMAELGVDLLLFAGGDGTARDLCSAVGDRVPVLGIPAGVKMHSAVFAVNPRAAGDLAARYLGAGPDSMQTLLAEVMDIDEHAFRNDRVSARLYGYVRIPYERGMVQSAKEGSQPGEEIAIDDIASDIVVNMQDDCLYLIGAGTTTRAVMEKLRLKNTLLGVDAVHRRALVGADLNEADMLGLIAGRKTRLVVGVIGRQGYLFGRGNQQISPQVIRKVGRGNIIVAATMNKMLSLAQQYLLVDTGDPQLDRTLRGHIQVVTGLHQRTVYRIA